MMNSVFMEKKQKAKWLDNNLLIEGVFENYLQTATDRPSPTHLSVLKSLG